MILKEKKVLFGMLFCLTILFSSFTVKESSSEDVNERRFFGAQVTYGPSYSLEPGSCYHNEITTIYVFWIGVQTTVEYGIPC